MGPAFPQACFPSLTLSIPFPLIPSFHSSYPLCLPIYVCMYLPFPGSALCTYHWQCSRNLNVIPIELGKQHAKQVSFLYTICTSAIFRYSQQFSCLFLSFYNHMFSTIVTLLVLLWKVLCGKACILSNTL